MHGFDYPIVWIQYNVASTIKIDKHLILTCFEFHKSIWTNVFKKKKKKKVKYILPPKQTVIFKVVL